MQVAGIIAVENDNLLLSDGNRIKADSLLFCTGYSHDYPFLDSSSGIVVEENGKYIRSIYKHIVNIERPTMAILNVPDPGYPLLVPHSQVFTKGLLRKLWFIILFIIHFLYLGAIFRCRFTWKYNAT